MPQKSLNELAGHLRQKGDQLLLTDIHYKSNKPLHKGIKSEASVLILLDKRDDDWYVFLTLRSENLRSYAGEVSFPGGKREPNDQTYVETAIREAHEETGLPFESFEIIGASKPILSKLQVLIHPVFALLTEEFEPLPNDEVQKCFWLPLRYFLMETWHDVVIVGQRWQMHRFEFPSMDIVYGLTAYLCILTAMLVHDKYPEFTFVKRNHLIKDRQRPIGEFIASLFDSEMKENLNFIFDLNDYLQKGKRGKL